MCSIFGLVYSDEAPISDGTLKKMARVLNHRGPDHCGFYQDLGIALGNNRLAIIDTEGGDQPIHDSNGIHVIVYNGEVYNHAEIRGNLESKGHVFKTQSDTETVLKAFIQYGPDCVNMLDGMFAFAIWNKKTRRLFLSRDRLGIKPLYYCQTKGGLAFASEAKALLPLVQGGVKPDWTAIYQYFTFGYIPPNRSPFAGIEKFPAGHNTWVETNTDKFEINPEAFWRPFYGNGTDTTVAQAPQMLHHRIEEAVGHELMSDVPLGIFLSGGLDSSAVAYFARKKKGHELTSFALKFEEGTHDESADAQLVADHIGLNHKELTMSPNLIREYLGKVANVLDEPFGDSTVLPLLALSEFARKDVKVVLTGWGGDEIFAGYPTLKAHRVGQAYRRLPRVISRELIPYIVNKLPVSDKYLSFEFKAKRFVRGIELPSELQHFLWMGYMDEVGKNNLFKPDILDQVERSTLAPVIATVTDLKETDLVSRIMHLDAAHFLNGNGLYQADRMSMAASLEARVPLLNNKLIDFAMTLPPEVLMPGGVPKGLLKQILAPHLPKSIINKPKKGFAPPSSTWIRGPLSNHFDTLFEREKVNAAGIFNPAEITRLLDEHKSRKADHGRNLWALISFQMWYDRFIN